MNAQTRSRAVDLVRARLTGMRDLSALASDPIGRLCTGIDPRPDRAHDGVLEPIAAMAAVVGDDRLLTVVTILKKLPEADRASVLEEAAEGFRVVASPSVAP